MAFSLLFLVIFSPAFAAIPQVIGFEGRLTDSSGNPVTGSTKVIYRIYDAETSPLPIYTYPPSGTIYIEPDSNGIFNSQIEIPSGYIDGTDRWLGIEIADNGEMTPRIRIVSAAHAYRALLADDSTKTAGKTIAATGSDIIPYTDGMGKLDASVIPGGAGGGTVEPDNITIGYNAYSSFEVKDGGISSAKLASGINISTTGYITAGSISANNFYMGDSPSGASMTLIQFTKPAGVTINPGDVVVQDTSTDNQVTTTTTQADDKVIGFAYRIEGNTVYVAIAGRIINATADNDIGRGDCVVTATTAGRVRGFTNKQSGKMIGVALNSVLAGSSSLNVLILKF